MATALAILSGATACGGGSDRVSATAVLAPAEPGDVVVKLVILEFEPKEVTVAAGRRVVWEWTDSVVHNVIAGGFRSKNLNGGSFDHRFTRAGRYAYQCTLHVGMVGTVVVTGG